MKIKAKIEVHEHKLDEFDNQNLKPSKIYEVIGLSHDHFRIINERGEPILYPKYLFEIMEPSIPERWIKRGYSRTEYYIDPPELSEPGFYEDYFDNKAQAKEIFKKFIKAYFHCGELGDVH